jgi:predicted nucleic acid-binding protein
LIAYVDSSALLRRLLRQQGELEEWRSFERMISSRLLEVESLRTLDRIRFQRQISGEALWAAREELDGIFEEFDFVELDRSVLVRASEPMPVALATLDAIHLATALLWREESGEDPVIATHDGELAQAARLFGFRVLGA